MAEIGDREALLLRECRTFTRYLVGREPDPDVEQAYQRAHEVSAVAGAGRPTPVDRALLGLAHLGPALTRIADAYAAAFARGSILRRKLVLLVAILESRPETAARLDTATPGSRGAWMVSSGLRICAFVLMLGLATLLVLPLSLWYRVGTQAVRADV